jgi:hypothetical protein
MSSEPSSLRCRYGSSAPPEAGCFALVTAGEMSLRRSLSRPYVGGEAEIAAAAEVLPQPM